MICLTGDIHHDSLKINDQKHITDPNLNEIRIVNRYMELIDSYNVKVTFYTTGKTLKEQWRDFRSVAESSLVEIGGHTYSGLPRSLAGRLRSLFGLTSVSHGDSHGSLEQQRNDIRKMIAIVKKRLGKDLVSWRSHGLVSDANTNRLLAEQGIGFLSDDLDWDKLYPERTEEGLISHPMNVIMDHDHLYHAHRTPAYVEKQRVDWPFKNDPTSESFGIEEWGKLVEKQVLEIERKGGVATVLMHPLCMYLADKFKTAERLIKLFSEYETVWACETGRFVR